MRSYTYNLPRVICSHLSFTFGNYAIKRIIEILVDRPPTTSRNSRDTRWKLSKGDINDRLLYRVCGLFLSFCLLPYLYIYKRIVRIWFQFYNGTRNAFLQVPQAKALLAKCERPSTSFGKSILRPFVSRVWARACSLLGNARVSSGAVLWSFFAGIAGSHRIRVQGNPLNFIPL